MIVPQFWAEARVRHDRPEGRITVRRFGWSDVSQAEAQAHADDRAADALRRLLAFESVHRADPKVPYNGAAGVPIREEIVARHGETIVTRNSYGARCLNTPNVLFADVDFPAADTLPCGCALVVAVLATAAGVARPESEAWAVVLAVLAGLGVLPVVAWVRRVRRRTRVSPDDEARGRIARFAADHPDWNLRVYRTPAGLRLLVTHQPFDPAAPDVRAFFAAVGADPMYVRMCLNQHCFRARVSPKPWRIGIATRMRPRPGVWPVRPERLAERTAWVAEYEAAATGFAACEFVEAVGSGIVHPAVGPVVKLHDDLCRATSGLPTA